jgi:hypothetical protein
LELCRLPLFCVLSYVRFLYPDFSPLLNEKHAMNVLKKERKEKTVQ